MAASQGRLPLDRRRYERDRRSRPVALGIPDGVYVFVQDLDQTVYVLPDAQHAHVRVLGGARPALYAGDMTISKNAIVDLTNASGTFEFSEPQGLLSVASILETMGFRILPGAVRLLSWKDARPATVLR